MRLPQLLQDPDDARALAVLRRYYGTGGAPEIFTGARFDAWDSTGTRAADRDRFTADDLVAVTFLSVNVSAPAAIRLLDTQAQTFSRLLSALGPDKDLANESSPWPDDWAGWQEAAPPPHLRLGRRRRHRVRSIVARAPAAATPGRRGSRRRVGPASLRRGGLDEGQIRLDGCVRLCKRGLCSTDGRGAPLPAVCESECDDRKLADSPHPADRRSNSLEHDVVQADAAFESGLKPGRDHSLRC